MCQELCQAFDVDPIFFLFICAYNVWVISPPFPDPLPYPPDVDPLNTLGNTVRYWGFFLFFYSPVLRDWFNPYFAHKRTNIHGICELYTGLHS
jgi:hypothetical protein